MADVADPVLNKIRQLNIHHELASSLHDDFESRSVRLSLEQYITSEERYVPSDIVFEGVSSFESSDIDLGDNRVQESKFPHYLEAFGPTLHDIVGKYPQAPANDIGSALDSVIYWKRDLDKELNRSPRMIAACAEFYGAVNSSGFGKYFETQA